MPLLADIRIENPRLNTAPTVHVPVSVTDALRGEPPNITSESAGEVIARAQAAPNGHRYLRSAQEQQPAEVEGRAADGDPAIVAEETHPETTGGADAATTENPAPARRRGRPFEKGGQSPNPGGRPKVPQDVKEAIKGRLLPKAIKVIEKILNTPKHPHRHAVALYVVDRVLGRPAAAITGADGAPLIPPGMPPDSPLTALLARLVASRGGASTTTSPASPNDDNAPPGANGAATEGKAS